MAASSSTAVAATAAPFPTDLVGETLVFRCRSQSYNGVVRAVHRRPELLVVLLRVKEKIPKRRFTAGEAAVLEAAGGRWGGVVADPEDGEDLMDSLYNWIVLHLPYPPAAKHTFTPNQIQLPNYSSHSWWSSHSHRCTTNIPLSFGFAVPPFEDSEPKAKPKPKVCKLKVGLIGFGAIGRHIAEIVAEIEDLELIAIVDNLTVYDMVMLWKSNNFSIRSCGEKAILFKRKNPELDRDDDTMVTILNAREHDKNPWGKLSVSYVIDTQNLFSEDNKRIIYSAHDCIHSPNQPPEDNHAVYTMVYDDNGVSNCFSLPIKYMKILISAEEGKQAVVESFPEWREGCANLCFCAEADPTERICDPLTELELLSECTNEEDRAERKEAGDRLRAILSCCVRILRRVAIGGIYMMV